MLKALPEKQRKKTSLEALRFPLLLVWQIISCPRKGKKKSLKDSSSYIRMKQTHPPFKKKKKAQTKQQQTNKQKAKKHLYFFFPVGSYFPCSDSWKSLEFCRFSCLFVGLIDCLFWLGGCCCLFGCGFGWLGCGFGLGVFFVVLVGWLIG